MISAHLQNAERQAQPERLLAVYRLGKIDYQRAYKIQERLLMKRTRGEITDTLLLLEHDQVITCGRSAKEAHLLADRQTLKRKGIEVIETDRGGDVTYHGPGQLVAYPIVDLGGKRPDVRRYVWSLEEVMIRIAARFGVSAGRIPGLNGAWIRDAKVGAVGVRVYRWVTMHGLALNVNTDLRAFDWIVACGIPGLRVTSLALELGLPVAMDEVLDAAVGEFSEVFSARVVSDGSTVKG